MRKLGVLLCYNDSDILRYSIESLLSSGHDIVAWDHGSNDETAQILNEYRDSLLEKKFIPRSVDFYKLYQLMSQHLIKTYIKNYDWVSWPDQDEILEGPSRDKSFDEHVREVESLGYDFIRFNNQNFWYTKGDDKNIKSPLDRIRHYSIFPDCSPRYRSWRASKTNIRHFNHNPIPGKLFPRNFNLRHYPMRSEEQMQRRLGNDRASLFRYGSNYHYKNMSRLKESIYVRREELHYDNLKDELSLQVKFDWRKIYGSSLDYKQSRSRILVEQALRKLKVI